MKNLLIGVFSDYSWETVKPWVVSASKLENCEKYLVVLNADFETVENIASYGIKAIICNADEEKKIVFNKTNIVPYVERFLHLYNFLNTFGNDYKFVITTDVKDVIFQKDPFEYLENSLGDKKLICGSECLKYKDEPWGDQNLRETFGNYIYSQFKNNEIFNVGVLGGYSEYVRDLCLNIFLGSINRPIEVVDQAVFNALISTKPYSDAVKFSRPSDGWVVHAGTTNDPSKIEGFKPNLLESPVQFIDGSVVNSSDEMIYIVHQYDRIPEWKDYFVNKFSE